MAKLQTGSYPLQFGGTTKHKLIIKSLYDARAECTCKGWYYAFTGEQTKKEIKIEYNKHICIGYNKKDIKLVAVGHTNKNIDDKLKSMSFS